MKIATLTLHNANNYGAKLQAYALQKFLLDSGFDTELIDYYPNTKHNRTKVSFIEKVWHRLIHMNMYIHKKRQAISFNKFSRELLIISKESFRGDDQIVHNPPNYDAYIAGSDQIWNTDITNNSKAFFLHFVSKGKKIAYAGSFGKTELTNDEIQNITKFLSRFDFLSVREKEHKELLKEKFGFEAQLVLDPVFLLNREKWSKIAASCKLPSKYVLVYVLEYSEEMFTRAKQIAKHLKCQVVYISLIFRKIQGEILVGLGPREYLYAFANAEYIVTNSFHGTAFSILFEKNFTVFKHSTRNSRIHNILQLAGLTDRYNDSLAKKMNPVNYEEVKKALDFHIKASKDFIYAAVGSSETPS